MKKVLLLASVILTTCTATVKAQTRMVLYEEFTGESCGDCATANPGLWTLMTSGTNPSKIQIIKYMVPIPAGGPFYQQNAAQANQISTYYNVSFDPYGRMDGDVPDPGAGQDAGDPILLTQSDIDNEAAIAAPFNITVAAAYNATFDSVTATIHINCISAYTGLAVYLRTALVETVDWNTPPGSNGETHFQNVVRTMYPNVTGTNLASSWTAGTNQTITITGAIPSYVDRSAAPYIVVWIQDEWNKKVAQSAKSAALGALPLDIASKSIVTNTTTPCTSDTATNFTANVTIKNAGTTAITSATVFYKVDNDTWTSIPWAGTLNAGDTVQLALPAISVSIGKHIITDSVALPNNIAEENSLNNNSVAPVFVLSTAMHNLPISCTFENNLPANWYILGTEYAAGNWGIDIGGASTNTMGHNSFQAAVISTMFANAGDKGYLIMPTPAITNPTSLDFWVAAAAQNAASTDALDVVYSTDCGSTWTSIWNKTGAALATTTAYYTSDTYIPAKTDWVHYSISLNNLPANSVLAFQGTSGNGNDIILDDINVTNLPASVNSVVTNNSISIYPNPATDNAVLSMSLTAAAKIQVQVIDEVGRTTISMNEMQLTGGTQHINISTATLAPGLYTVKIMSDNSVISTQRLSVVK